MMPVRREEREPRARRDGEKDRDRRERKEKKERGEKDKNKSSSSGAKPVEPKSVVLVSGLQKHHNFDALFGFFKQFAKVTSVRIRDDRLEAEIGFGEVEGAARAVAATSGGGPGELKAAFKPQPTQPVPKAKPAAPPVTAARRQEHQVYIGTAQALTDQLQKALRNMLLPTKTEEEKTAARQEVMALKAELEKLRKAKEEKVDAATPATSQ